LLDFPGKVACIIFTAGCNLRCSYCHNSDFVLPEKIKEIIEIQEKLHLTLGRKRKKLASVVFLLPK
jgi:pyruvate formate lyase activating enzyme